MPSASAPAYFFSKHNKQYSCTDLMAIVAVVVAVGVGNIGHGLVIVRVGWRLFGSGCRSGSRNRNRCRTRR